MAVSSGTRNHRSHDQSNRQYNRVNGRWSGFVSLEEAQQRSKLGRGARATGPRLLRSVHNENNAGPNQQLWRVHPIALLLPPGRPSVAKRRTVGSTLEKLPRVATQAALDRATRLPNSFFNDIVPMAECRKMTTTRGDVTC
jgi:hypothetical protein